MTINELVRKALRSRDNDAYWALVRSIGRHSTSEAFKMAQGLSDSQRLRERILSADILSCLGVPNTELTDESIQVLLLLLNDLEPKVVSASAFALGSYESRESIGPLVALAEHPETEVRRGVAYALGYVRDAPNAVETLLLLSRDVDASVRATATMLSLLRTIGIRQ